MRILLALDFDVEARLLENILVSGHEVVDRVAGADALVESVTRTRPDAVVAQGGPETLTVRSLAACDAAGSRIVVLMADEVERRNALALGVVDRLDAQVDWPELEQLLRFTGQSRRGATGMEARDIDSVGGHNGWNAPGSATGFSADGGHAGGSTAGGTNAGGRIADGSIANSRATNGSRPSGNRPSVNAAGNNDGTDEGGLLAAQDLDGPGPALSRRERKLRERQGSNRRNGNRRGSNGNGNGIGDGKPGGDAQGRPQNVAAGQDSSQPSGTGKRRGLWWPKRGAGHASTESGQHGKGQQGTGRTGTGINGAGRNDLGRIDEGATNAMGSQPGNVLAVWGPYGAPGRTSLAIALAASFANRGQQAVLIDADPYGGAVAQLLGIADESPGLAAACRLAGAGALNSLEFDRIASQVKTHSSTFRVLGGIVNPERWPELSRSRMRGVIEQAKREADIVIVDVGFNLERDEELVSDVAAPRRNAAIHTVLEHSDTVIALAEATPLGIQRYLRARLHLLESVGAKCHIEAVANKVRGSVSGVDAGAQVRQVLRRFGGIEQLTLLPNDPKACDRAIAGALSIVDASPRSQLSRQIGALAERVSARQGESDSQSLVGLSRVEHHEPYSAL